MALANEQKREEKTDLAEFIGNKGAKAVDEALNVGWEMENAEAELQRSKLTRIEILHNELGKACVAGCAGKWLTDFV